MLSSPILLHAFSSSLRGYIWGVRGELHTLSSEQVQRGYYMLFLSPCSGRSTCIFGYLLSLDSYVGQVDDEPLARLFFYGLNAFPSALVGYLVEEPSEPSVVQPTLKPFGSLRD